MENDSIKFRILIPLLNGSDPPTRSTNPTHPLSCGPHTLLWATGRSPPSLPGLHVRGDLLPNWTGVPCRAPALSMCDPTANPTSSASNSADQAFPNGAHPCHVQAWLFTPCRPLARAHPLPSPVELLPPIGQHRGATPD
jgi:hypothetical protein